MRLLKVAAGVLNQTPLDWEGNFDRIVRCINEARGQNVAVLCLPEMCITGYGCEDAFLSPDVQAQSLQRLQEIATQTNGMAVCVGLPIVCAGGLFNGVAMLVDGKLVGIGAKQHLAGDGIHYEPRWFKPWPAEQMIGLDLPFDKVPIGDLVFNLNGVRIGLEICEDAWVGPRPGANLAQRGVDIILNPSASHFSFGKHEIRKRFVQEGSRAFQVTYVYTNLVGNESGRAIFDGDAMIACGGKLLAAGKRFSFQESSLVSGVIDLDWTRMLRVQTASFRPQIAHDQIGDEVTVGFSLPEISDELWAADVTAGNRLSSDRSTDAEDKPSDLISKEQEFTLAVSLGLFDYVRKSHSAGIVVSLSGGADSAAVTLLGRFMLDLACQELGFAEVKRKFGLEKNKALSNVGQLAKRMITTVYQATVNSSETTSTAAQTVADLAGSTHYQWNVDAIVGSLQDIVENAIGRKLTWQQDDITLQNVQARSRSPGVWMLANINNALLLATSNRSEAAVGYATMDGDTSGGLSPIAGIDKNFLRQWLRWVESTGMPLIGPMPDLSCINRQDPTAELRPSEQGQTDETDLMPYDVLDAAERLAIRDKIAPMGVFRHLQRLFPQHSPDQLSLWTKRFFSLWSRNQWKRERYAPCFHLDDENLDPKTWCRWPILSGGFVKQLEQLP